MLNLAQEKQQLLRNGCRSAQSPEGWSHPNLGSFSSGFDVGSEITMPSLYNIRVMDVIGINDLGSHLSKGCTVLSFLSA